MVAYQLVLVKEKKTDPILDYNESSGVEMHLDVVEERLGAILTCLEPTYYADTNLAGHLFAGWTLAD
jgi:hypothetical protein